MFEAYFPYLMSAIDSKMARWGKFASTGETIEMVEETWTLAAEMVCKALFDREMPFTPTAAQPQASCAPREWRGSRSRPAM